MIMSFLGCQVNPSCPLWTPGSLGQQTVSLIKEYDDDAQSRTCPICGKLLTRRFKMADHLRTHTGEKPFSCPYCSYRAAQKYNITLHVKKRHKSQALDCSSFAN